MATPGLTFLYPALLRAARVGTTSTSRRYLSFVSLPPNATFSRRRGKAVEPAPFPMQGEPLKDLYMAAEDEDEAVGKGATGATSAAEAEADAEAEDAAAAAEDAIVLDQPQTTDTASNVPPKKETELPIEEQVRLAQEDAKPGGPLEAVLMMQPPENAERQHPSMSPPPYVHHFDSYSLVKQLQDGGYTQTAATTAMKGIRNILAQNLDVAQSSLISKSDVENESYLFSAACAELSTEIKNNRRIHDEALRQQRTHLQHEVDILNQSLNQELLTLNDNVRGMFNDRKMAVREEQKTAESAVQQIHYKISIDLTSDAKSEIEAVRWILIRRSVLGILFMAVMTLTTLRYATYVGQERKRAAEQQKRDDEERRRDGGKRDHSFAADAAVILEAN
ncbi:hypothetical protein G7046_g9590 [Stylonectria norvegica]|nr:hypothetical protein G7046_g9590 [Stylonectria norvegica]